MPIDRRARAAYSLLLDPAHDRRRITPDDLERALRNADAAADPANSYLVVTPDGSTFGCASAADAVDLITAHPGVNRIVCLGGAA